MFGPDLFATLALAASIMAPALAPRTDWVGEIVFIKKPGTNGSQVFPTAITSQRGACGRSSTPR